jgi:hypothetical protein
MNITETEYEGMEWNNLAQDRDLWKVLLKMVVKFQVP